MPPGRSDTQHGDPAGRPDRAERTRELIELAHATRDAERRRELLGEVVVLNGEVARAVAARYRSRGLPQEDLVQTAFEGLVKAVWRFDPAQREDLLVYAVPTIRGEVQRYFRDQGWMVRPPRRVQELQQLISRTAHTLAIGLGREPTEAEVVHELALAPAAYREAVLAWGCFQPASLDLAPGDVRTSLADLIAEEHDPVALVEARALLAPYVRQLPPRDRELLYLRFFCGLTQGEVGTCLGITQMQVSRRLTAILGRLRDALDDGESREHATPRAKVS